MTPRSFYEWITAISQSASYTTDYSSWLITEIGILLPLSDVYSAQSCFPQGLIKGKQLVMIQIWSVKCFAQA